jgi:hypothetical protein
MYSHITFEQTIPVRIWLRTQTLINQRPLNLTMAPRPPPAPSNHGMRLRNTLTMPNQCEDGHFARLWPDNTTFVRPSLRSIPKPDWEPYSIHVSQSDIDNMTRCTNTSGPKKPLRRCEFKTLNFPGLPNFWDCSKAICDECNTRNQANAKLVRELVQLAVCLQCWQKRSRKRKSTCVCPKIVMNDGTPMPICLACVVQYAIWCQSGKFGPHTTAGLNWAPGSRASRGPNNWAGGNRTVGYRRSIQHFMPGHNPFPPHGGTYWRVTNLGQQPTQPNSFMSPTPMCVCGRSTPWQGDHTIKQQTPHAGLGAVRSCAVCTVEADPYVWPDPVPPRVPPYDNDPGARGWVYKRRNGTEMF